MQKIKFSYSTAEKVMCIGFGGILSFAAVAGGLLSGVRVSADEIDPVAITVGSSCTMSGSGNDSHTATLGNGIYSGASGNTYENGIGATTITVFCNDYNGFSIYATGYTGDGLNNTLVGSSTSQVINTKVYASGDTASNWAMKVTKVSDSTAYTPANMAIQDSFDSWHTVPNTYTKVAQYKASTGSSATDMGTGALGGKITTTYAAYISSTQAADTYEGQVKYVLIHPYNGTAPTEPGS